MSIYQMPYIDENRILYQNGGKRGMIVTRYCMLKCDNMCCGRTMLA